jgi:hypothetical protein
MNKFSSLSTPVILIFILLLSLSCTKKSSDRKKITIRNFENKFLDSLLPLNKSDTNYHISLKGYTNDSIKIIFGRERDHPNFPFFLKDSINATISFDYYGNITEYFTFDPYKATDGYLKIEYQLLGY